MVNKNALMPRLKAEYLKDQLPGSKYNANEHRSEIYALLSDDMKEVWDSMLMPVDTTIDFHKVILSEENMAKYNDFLIEQGKKDLLSKYGFYPVNRLLLYGASGTGKTYSLKALANELGFIMLYVDIAEALTKGNVADNIHKIFDLSHVLGECLIFFDECDAIAWNRDTGTPESGAARRATNAIFQCLDQMDWRCVFASATNMLNRLDLAFERRFDIKMQFTTPKLDINECIEHFNRKRFKIVDDVAPSRRNIVQRRMSTNPKASYYGIEVAVESAMKKSLLENGVPEETGVPELHTKVVYDLLARTYNIKFRLSEDGTLMEGTENE